MRHKTRDDVNGWLVIDKETGIGSTEIVNKTRYLLNANKNGHTGTLDPFASGVLPVAFGEATKLVSYVMNGTKEYEFRLKFGQATDTLDLTGKIIKSGGKIPSEEEIAEGIKSFRGKITQIPPKYSAIKINGQRAYDLAREGKEVKIEPREIEIFDLEFKGWHSESEADFRVECSKGTYVRTLGADLAQKIGTIGHLSALRRTKCGPFSLKDTILLEKIKNMEYVDSRQKLLLPLMTSLCDITVIAVREEDAIKLRYGQGLSPKSYDLGHLEGREVLMSYNEKPIAMVRIEKTRISPVRVFNL